MGKVLSFEKLIKCEFTSWILEAPQGKLKLLYVTLQSFLYSPIHDKAAVTSSQFANHVHVIYNNSVASQIWLHFTLSWKAI